MKRIFLIHRWSGGPNDDWRPWLKTELEKAGHQVIVPEMPDTETPVIEKWVNHLAALVGNPDKDTFFVGHSIGNQAIMRYLQTLNAPVGGAVFVAGWFNLENMEDDEVRAIAKPWIETPIDTGKLARILPLSTLIISDDDPFGCFEENVQKFERFVTKTIIKPGAGHFTEASGFKELPVALEEIQEMMQ